MGTRCGRDGALAADRPVVPSLHTSGRMEASRQVEVRDFQAWLGWHRSALEAYGDGLEVNGAVFLNMSVFCTCESPASWRNGSYKDPPPQKCVRAVPVCWGVQLHQDVIWQYLVAASSAHQEAALCGCVSLHFSFRFFSGRSLLFLLVFKHLSFNHKWFLTNPAQNFSSIFQQNPPCLQSFPPFNKDLPFLRGTPLSPK